MLQNVVDLLACPVCADPFELAAKSLVCRSGHSFDVARQGYVNLLNRKPPANADTAQMLQHRARFLAAGFYRPIRDRLVTAISEREPVIEVGAGTGYYLAGIKARQQLALDISVAAAKASSRAGLASVVADTWQRLPLQTASVAVVLEVFAPRNPAEFARVLTPGGNVFVVTPTAQHLGGLRGRFGLLNIEPAKLQRLDQVMDEVGLSLQSRETLEFVVELDACQVEDLIKMGPNAFHLETENFSAAETLVSVDFSVFTKTV